jgi:trk system potassium uptake protein TrkH
MWKSIKDFLGTNSRILDHTLLYISLIASLGIIAQLGSGETKAASNYLDLIFWLFGFLGATLVLRTITTLSKPKQISRFQIWEILFSCYFVLVFIWRYSSFHSYLYNGWIYAGIFSIFLVELSKGSLFFDRFYFNPTLLFVISFLLLIFLGTLLLMLPNATTGTPLEIVDALFMSTSAVCITGLSVIDISIKLSDFGQVVILILVQLGGLGVMTFTGFFGYFFSGGFSYKNQLMFTELVAENKLASVINTLMKIVFITLTIEVLGAIAIYFFVEGENFSNSGARTFFALFHAISAFCNAGFSILPEGLHDQSVRFNYGLQLIVTVLFILGGLGFGIVMNVYYFVKRWIINIYKRLMYRQPFIYRAWVINFNSRLVAWMTLILLVIGTVGMFALESNGSLAEHTGVMGKLIGAFFMGASPRTAGFNSIDMNTLSFPSIMLIILLMWIGASPGSTGGGIKTTTLAVAVLNVTSLVKGKDRVEAFGREITIDSIRRSSAIILLSLFILGLAIFALSITDGSKKLLELAFESVSAFSTVGLTLGITPELSPAGRIILTLVMFIGRVGTLTLIIAFIKKTTLKSYRYPQEKVLF